MHSLIRLYHLPCSPFFILFIPHLFSCSSPIVSFLPSPIIENKKTENPGKNVYITKYCRMLSILPRYSHLIPPIYIYIYKLSCRDHKVLSSNLQIFTRNQYSSYWLPATIGWRCKGLASVKKLSRDLRGTHCDCIENAGFFRLSLLLSRAFLLKLTSERR